MYKLPQYNILLKSNICNCYILRNVFRQYHRNRKVLKVAPSSILMRTGCNINYFSSSSTFSDESDEDIYEIYGHNDLMDLLDSDINRSRTASSITLLQNLLYPNSDDPMIKRLNNCKTLQEVFVLIGVGGPSTMDKAQTVQSVIVLWDLLNKRQANIENITERDEFIRLLENINTYAEQMSAEELSCVLLYLTKIGLDIKQNETMKNLVYLGSHMLKDRTLPFPLTALSKFAVAMNSTYGLYNKFICIDIVPRLIELLENDSLTTDDIRLITICLQNLNLLISDDLLSLYKQRIEEMLENGTLGPHTNKALMKIINFLNFPYISLQNSRLIRRLAILSKTNMNEFQEKELVLLHRIFQTQLEPAELLPAISERSQELLAGELTAEILACSVLYSLPENRLKMSKMAEKIIYSDVGINQTEFPALFKVLRLLKISNMKLCDMFWTKVVEEIVNNPEERKIYRLIRHCHRYMHFNNNLGGTYRHYRFEKVLLSLIQNELATGISQFIPTKFAKLTSFVFAYSTDIPDSVIQKIESMSEQFTIHDCRQLSRGLQIAYELKYRNHIPEQIVHKVNRIENVLNICIEKYLKCDKLSLQDINSLIRTYNNKKSSRSANLFQELIQKYENTNDDLNSRLIRDITFNLIVSNHRVDKMLERLLNYIVENKDYITGGTVERILTCCYNLGYIPEDNKALQYSVEIVMRDFPFMSGLSIIQSCLALGFFKILPIHLVNAVFNIEFIKRLEQEIQLCYSKASYPERVLNVVMQLNRMVCLDCPEAAVPWFQQNYIEAQMSRQSNYNSNFQIECRNLLLQLVKDSNYLKIDEVTPYGYKIDFVLHLDKDKKFIQSPPSSNKVLMLNHITKIAILLLKLDAFCENSKLDTNANYYLRGVEYLRERHLEILGYKVVHINLNEWNSMYMNLPGAKNDYLRNLLQLS